MTARRHESESDVIGYGTDPWLECNGTAVDLTQFDSKLFPAGVFAPVNDDYGIERDDEADIFQSDFGAAQALAGHLHERTGLTFEVWFDDGVGNDKE